MAKPGPSKGPTKTCTSPGCTRVQMANELCAAHYRQVERAEKRAVEIVNAGTGYLASDDFKTALERRRADWKSVAFSGVKSVVERKREVLAHIELLYFWMVACDVAGVSRADYARWMDTDEVFVDAAAEATEYARQRMEFRMYEAGLRPDPLGKFNFQACVAWLNKHADWSPVSRQLDETRNAKFVTELGKILKDSLPVEAADEILGKCSSLAERAALLPPGASLR